MSKENSNDSGKAGLSRRHFLRSSAAVAVVLPLSGLALAADVKAAEEVKKAMAQAKSLLVERKNCTGCNSCVFACSLFHDNEVRPATARIHVRRFYGLVDVPIMCWHCPDAPCVESCPTTPKAIVKNKETNVVEFTDEKLCLGAKCNKCMEACPPQYLRRHPDTGMPLFCDLCKGDPECVKACARQSKETGETLRCDTQIAGLHWSYREVTPEEAADGLMKKLFYPNLKGERK